MSQNGGVYVHKSGKRLSKEGAVGLTYVYASSSIDDILEIEKADIFNYLYVLYVQSVSTKNLTRSSPDYVILQLYKDKHKEMLTDLLSHQNTLNKLYKFYYIYGTRQTVINRLIKMIREFIPENTLTKRPQLSITFDRIANQMYDFFENYDLVISGYIDNSLLPENFNMNNINEYDISEFRRIGLVAVKKDISTKRFKSIFTTGVLYKFSTSLNNSVNRGESNEALFQQETVAKIKKGIIEYLRTDRYLPSNYITPRKKVNSNNSDTSYSRSDLQNNIHTPNNRSNYGYTTEESNQSNTNSPDKLRKMRNKEKYSKLENNYKKAAKKNGTYVKRLKNKWANEEEEDNKKY
jgi:hypothetical protein